MVRHGPSRLDSLACEASACLSDPGGAGSLILDERSVSAPARGSTGGLTGGKKLVLCLLVHDIYG